MSSIFFLIKYLSMPAICHICQFVPNTITHTFKNVKTGQWRHYCLDHLNLADKTLVHLPFSDELTGDDPHTYSGPCKICNKIGHKKCLGYFPSEPHSL